MWIIDTSRSLSSSFPFLVACRRHRCCCCCWRGKVLGPRDTAGGPPRHLRRGRISSAAAQFKTGHPWALKGRRRRCYRAGPWRSNGSAFRRQTGAFCKVRNHPSPSDVLVPASTPPPPTSQRPRPGAGTLGVDGRGGGGEEGRSTHVHFSFSSII